MAVRQRVILSGAAVVAATLFVILAILVARHVGPIERFDLSVHASWRQYALAHPTWLSFMRNVTRLGDTLTVVVVDVTLFAVCLWRSRRRTALFVAVVAVGVWVVRLVLRELVGRARPDVALWPVSGLSFPSGHATNSAAMAALIVVVCWPLLRRAGRIAVVVAAVICAVSVGLSRVVGGVHWPSDVIGGLLLASAMVCAAAALFPPDPPTAKTHVDDSAQTHGAVPGVEDGIRPH
jgi:membrane-associated phospholipid phosphatase